MKCWKSNLIVLLFLFSCKEVVPIALTVEDQQFINIYFNNTIDSTKIELYEGNSKDFLARTIGHKIYFLPELNYEMNKEELKPLFVHELVHVWQYEHPFSFKKVNINNYTYTLSEFKQFEDYGPEEQASIIQDYYYASELGEEEFPLCLDCFSLSKDEIINQLSYLYYEMRAK